MVLERLGVRQRGLVTEEIQTPGVVRRREPLQEQSAEQPREDADREEEPVPARYPALAVRRDTAAWHPWLPFSCKRELSESCRVACSPSSRGSRFRWMSLSRIPRRCASWTNSAGRSHSAADGEPDARRVPGGRGFWGDVVRVRLTRRCRRSTHRKQSTRLAQKHGGSSALSP